MHLFQTRQKRSLIISRPRICATIRISANAQVSFFRATARPKKYVLKTQKKNIYPLENVPDKHQTQEMCDKAVENNHIFWNKFPTHEKCNKAESEDSSSLQ